MVIFLVAMLEQWSADSDAEKILVPEFGMVKVLNPSFIASLVGTILVTVPTSFVPTCSTSAPAASSLAAGANTP